MIPKIRPNNIAFSECDTPEEVQKILNDLYRINRAQNLALLELAGKGHKSKPKPKFGKAAGLILLFILLFASVADAITYRWEMFNADDMEKFMNAPELGAIELGTVTLANGLTIENSTNNVLEINENSENLLLTFSSNTIAATSTTGLVLFNWGAIVPAANQMLLNPVADAIGTVEGTLYYDSDDDNLYVRETSGWTDLTASASGVTDLDGAYDGGVTITVDAGSIVATATDVANNTILTLVQEDTSAATTLLITGSQATANAISIDIDAQTTGRDVEGTSASWYVTGAGAGTFASLNTTAGATTTTTLGVGTDLTVTGVTTANGNVTLGNAVTDTITMTGYIIADVSLDDGSGAPPQLIFRDGSDETAAFNKTLTGALSLTTQSDDGLNIVVGNLRVGNGTPGTAPMDGEDAYFEGQVEFDSQTTFDAVAVHNEWIDLNEELDIDMDAADETVTIDTSATTYAADSAIVTVTTAAAATDNTYLLRLRHTANLDAQDHFLVLEDNAGDDKLAINSAGDTQWTLDPAAMVGIDATTVANTSTGGVIDLDVESATNGNTGISITYELETGATAGYGIDIDVDDDSGGAEFFYGLNIGNSAGTNATVVGINAENTLDDVVVATLGVTGQYLTLDASTATNTTTTGLFDIGAILSESAASVINIDVESEADTATEEVYGIFVQMDDDADNADNEIHALHVQGDGTDGTGLQHGIVVQGANIDAGVWLETGYLRVGTGGTPGQALGGADNVYIEGTLEVDGGFYADSGTLTLANGITITTSTNEKITFADTEDITFNLTGADVIVLETSTSVATIDFGVLDSLIGVDDITADNGQVIEFATDEKITLSDTEDLTFDFTGSDEIVLTSSTGVVELNFGAIDLLSDIETLDSGTDAYMKWLTNGKSQKVEYINLCYISASEIRATSPGTGMLCVGLAGVDDLFSTEGYIDLSDGTDYVRFAIQIPSDFIDAGNVGDLQIEFDLWEKAAENVDLEVRIFEYGNTTPIITDTITIVDAAARTWSTLDTLSTGIGADADIDADDVLYIELTQEGADHAEDVYLYGVRVTYEIGIEATGT